MSASFKDLSNSRARDETCVRVTVIKADGSTPREAGAAMFVFDNDMAGTIGGGALEHDAVLRAREMINADSKSIWLRYTNDYPLGPRLGQCCGGHVRLLFERFGEIESAHISALIDTGAAYFARPVTSGGTIVGIGSSNEHVSPPPFLLEAISTSSQQACFLLSHPEVNEMWFVERITPKQLVIYLYGAGHVAREIVRVFAGMDVEVVWIDAAEDRYPKTIPTNVKRLIAATPQAAAAYAPENAFHVVMTCSHPLDLEICHAILKRGVFRYLGLIGSQTKRERFSRRLRELGIPEGALARLTCPIGANGPKGKEPAVIAVALAGEILKLNDRSETP